MRTDAEAEVSLDVHWVLIVRLEPQFRGLCRRACKGHHYLLDELWGVVLDRVPSICETWDPDYHVPIEAHVTISLKWYLWKWMRRRLKRHVQGWEHVELDTQAIKVAEPISEVQEVMELLSPEDAEILTWHHVDNLNFADIADELGTTRNQARTAYMGAIGRARELALRLEEEGRAPRPAAA